MTDPGTDLPPLGKLLEDARKRIPLSKREAARRAKISEARWRQIVTGWQNPNDPTVPARPRHNTVIAAARAVGVDPAEALEAAGLDPAAGDEPEPPVEDLSVRKVLLAEDLTVAQQEAIIRRLISEKNEHQRKLNALVDELIAQTRSQE